MVRLTPRRLLLGRKPLRFGSYGATLFVLCAIGIQLLLFPAALQFREMLEFQI
jgi:hypothetical protein